MYPVYASDCPTDTLLIPRDLHSDTDLVRDAQKRHMEIRKDVLTSASTLSAVLIANCLPVLLRFVVIIDIMSRGAKYRNFYIHPSPSIVELDTARSGSKEDVPVRDERMSASCSIRHDVGVQETTCVQCLHVIRIEQRYGRRLLARDRER